MKRKKKETLKLAGKRCSVSEKKKKERQSQGIMHKDGKNMWMNEHSSLRKFPPLISVQARLLYGQRRQQSSGWFYKYGL